MKLIQRLLLASFESATRTLSAATDCPSGPARGTDLPGSTVAPAVRDHRSRPPKPQTHNVRSCRTEDVGLTAFSAAGLKVECQDVEVFHWREAVGVVEPQRCGVAWFCLAGQAKSPGGGRGRPDGGYQCPRGTAAAGARHNIRMRARPRPSRCHQLLAGMSGIDGQRSSADVAGQPGYRLPRHHGLAVMVPVLVKHPATSVAQLPRAEPGQPSRHSRSST